MNTLTHIIMHTTVSFLLINCLAVEYLGHYIDMGLIFLKKEFSKKAELSYTPDDV